MGVGCGCGTGKPDFSKLAEEFVYTNLSFSPVSATAAGYHKHNGIELDRMLDDMSLASLDRQRQFYTRFRERLNSEVDREKLSAEDRADYGIIQDQISLNLLELDQIHSFAHNPTLYVETVGNALFSPYVLEYAPRSRRVADIIERLKKIPVFLDQARINLMSSPEIWNTVAQQENAGNIELIRTTIASAVPPEQKAEFDRAAAPAIKALQDFQEYLKVRLSLLNDYDWRLGRDNYTKKFRYVLATDQDPAEVLHLAEVDLERVRARMLQVALPLHRKMYPGHGEHSDLAGAERENRVISEVLARIADRHSTPKSYLDDARQYVSAKHLLTLPARGNLQVIETPEFMRGIYGVGGFAPAPALEPQLGAFYWVTPIPADWPRQRVESKLREYNFYKLKLLTIHEAMPGHYVQMEVANDIQPRSRRILRSLFGNGPYIEGWAQYATQCMLDSGFLDNSPELLLTFQKEELRVLANAILDVRLQMLGMTDEEALDLMEKQTFQEHEEAAAKLQRAKLSSAQLPTYRVGWQDWLRVRERYRAMKPGFNLADFNDRALREGAVPLPVLARLLTGTALGESK